MQLPSISSFIFAVLSRRMNTHAALGIHAFTAAGAAELFAPEVAWKTLMNLLALQFAAWLVL